MPCPPRLRLRLFSLSSDGTLSRGHHKRKQNCSLQDITSATEHDMRLHSSLTTKGEQNNKNTASIGPHRHLRSDGIENIGVSSSQNPTGLHGLLSVFGIIMHLTKVMVHSANCKQCFTAYNASLHAGIRHVLRRACYNVLTQSVHSPLRVLIFFYCFFYDAAVSQTI